MEMSQLWGVNLKINQETVLKKELVTKIDAHKTE